MPDPFIPKFVDMVRNFTTTQGQSNFVLGTAVTGFTSLATAVAVGDRFYYCVTDIDKPAEREVGRGTRMADGTIAREPTGGVKTNFSSGNKTIALIVAAEWFQNAGAIPTILFSDIPARTFPTTLHRIDTNGRTAAGQHAASYLRDPDQTANTAIGQQFIDALPTPAQAAAVSAVQAILSRIRLADASGVYWVIDDDAQEVDAGHFGAAMNATFNLDTGTITGTNDQPAIQALIDWRLYLRRTTRSASRPIQLPPGNARIADSIQLSYGDSSRKMKLSGALGGSASPSNCSALLCDFHDRPAIAVSGGRQAEIENLSAFSPGSAWFRSKSLVAPAQNSLADFGIDDLDIVNHYDPTFSQRSPLLRYNPCAAIAVDPFAGNAPSAATSWMAATAVSRGQYRTANSKLFIARYGGTTASSGSGPSASISQITDGTVIWDYAGPSSVAVAYPAMTTPAFLPAAQRITYGRNISSSVVVRNCTFVGFSVGLAIQPSDAEGNGDSVAVEDVEFHHVAIALSVGNARCRNLSLSRTRGFGVHTFVTTRHHGRQSGRLGGTWADWSTVGAINLVDLGPAADSGPLTINGGNAENIFRIGHVHPGEGSARGAVIGWSGGEMVFNHQTGFGKHGVPQYLLGSREHPWNAGDRSAGWTLERVRLVDFKAVAPLLVGNLVLRDCEMQDADQATTPSAQWQARYLNTLAGGLVAQRLAPGDGHTIVYKARNETVLSSSAVARTGRASRSSSRDFPAALYTASLSPANGQDSEYIVNPQRVSQYAKSSFGSLALSDRTLTFTVNGSPALYNSIGLVPGGVLFDDDNGMVFVIQSRSGDPAPHSFTCQLQNCYRYSAAGAISHERAFRITAGNFQVAGGGIFTPSYATFGDVTSAGATIAAMQRGDGGNGHISAAANSDIQVGDTLHVDELRDFFFTAGSSVISAVTGTVTLSGVAQADTLQKRLPLWIRGS